MADKEQVRTVAGDVTPEQFAQELKDEKKTPEPDAPAKRKRGRPKGSKTGARKSARSRADSEPAAPPEPEGMTPEETEAMLLQIRAGSVKAIHHGFDKIMAAKRLAPYTRAEAEEFTDAILPVAMIHAESIAPYIPYLPLIAVVFSQFVGREALPDTADIERPTGREINPVARREVSIAVVPKDAGERARPRRVEFTPTAESGDDNAPV